MTTINPTGASLSVTTTHPYVHRQGTVISPRGQYVMAIANLPYLPPTEYFEDWTATPTPPLRPEQVVAPTIPGAPEGGMVETVKRAVMTALREALTGTTLNGMVNGSEVSIDMEFPMQKENYPGIWVQFSFTEIVQAGIGHQPVIRNVVSEATATHPAVINWEPVREVQFKGRITLTVVALTSLERDRLSDSIFSMLAFSRPPESVLTNPSEDTKQFRQLISSLANNPYVSITLNHDIIYPGGQAMTTGVPWDEEIPGYEDNYSFDILGQTNIVFRRDGTFTLRNIIAAPVLANPYAWQ